MDAAEAARKPAAALAGLLDEAMAQEWDDESETLVALLGEAGDDGEFALAIKPLPGHPLESLRGAVVDPKWQAIAVSSLGRVFSLIASANRRPERVRITYAVSRRDEATVIRRQHTDELQHLSAGEGAVPALLRDAMKPSRLLVPGSWRLDPEVIAPDG